MLLVLLEQTRGKNFEDLWFSPAVAAQRYGLSEVTRRRGVEELRELGAIVVDRVPVGRGSLSVIRQRNTYSVNMPRFAERPDDEPEALVIVRNAATRAARSARRQEKDIEALFAPTGKTDGASDDERRSTSSTEPRQPRLT
jgi:hypothetical protein